MRLEPKLLCDLEDVRFVNEADLSHPEKGLMTLSVTGQVDIQKDAEPKIIKEMELMIFLGKSECDNEYEVRIYKYDSSDSYVPDQYDHVIRYEENSEYDTFFFNNFIFAKFFIATIMYYHHEYSKRPLKEVA